jgi:protein-L-isoaspartate(D-aspartate) O-methyltransferase
MTDFAAARRRMVDSQVRPSDVTDLRIINAMLAVPRERFLAPEQVALAYLDLDIPVGGAEPGKPVRRLLKPMVLAKLIQAAEIGEADHVLDVGCATGYSTAVLAELVPSPVALEEEPALAELANANLANANPQASSGGAARVVAGPLAEGWPAAAPYDVILVNGAFEVAPKRLLAELKPGGRLVGILGRGPAGKAMLYRSVGGEVSGRPIFDAAGHVLPGFAAPPAFVF